MTKTVHDLGTDAKAHMVELIQEFSRSGLLEASIKLDELPEGFALYPNVYYAQIVNDGAGPHTINGNPFLMFVKNGQLVFTKHVNHPGFKGKQYIDNTLEWLERETDIRLQQVTIK
jgi:hypothetical protein